VRPAAPSFYKSDRINFDECYVTRELLAELGCPAEGYRLACLCVSSLVWIEISDGVPIASFPDHDFMSFSFIRVDLAEAVPQAGRSGI
jgi:hypothetical protein